MTGLLPVIFALTILDTSRPMRGFHPLPWGWWILVFALSLLTWLVLSEIVARALSRVPDRRALEAWDLAANLIMLTWLGWICFGLGWTSRVQAYTPAILPWVVMQAAHWWCMATGLRGREENRGWTRYRLILHQVRFGMPPMLAILPVFDLCNWLTVRTGLQPWMLKHLGLPMTMTIGSLALGIAAVVLMPIALVHMWRARPLGPGPLLDLLERACRHMGVRVRRIMLWPDDGGRVYNAAVIGVLPVMRYVLFTPDLLQDFAPRQVLSVLGHELGHARYRHLQLYLLFALATLLVALVLADPLTTQLGHLQLAARLSPELRKCVVTLALVAIKWRLIFGYLSRACERQADLAGAELCGDPDIMRSALRSVAQLSGQSETIPSWRHYSIAQRAEFLARVVEDPALVPRHHRQVRIWWWTLSALVLALSSILAIIAARTMSA